MLSEYVTITATESRTTDASPPAALVMEMSTRTTIRWHQLVETRSQSKNLWFAYKYQHHG